MTTQLLIYETAVPVSSGRHGKASVEAGKGYAFTRKINSVPLMAVEFPQAAPEYAIVFAKNGDSVVPVVILGARRGENLYIQEDDSWTAKYLPAFIRRYPFVFSPEASVNWACIGSSSFRSTSFLPKACVRRNCVRYSCRNFSTLSTYGVCLPSSVNSAWPRPW